MAVAPINDTMNLFLKIGYKRALLHVKNILYYMYKKNLVEVGVPRSSIIKLFRYRVTEGQRTVETTRPRKRKLSMSFLG